LDFEIRMANEWLSKALEMNPISVKNHYRKGKLIIEKQAPYLLFGKKSFGAAEAKTIREIRQVGEEHLATAISLYEALEDEAKIIANKREYAKALFVLGRFYLSDTNLSIHAYYLSKLAGKQPEIRIEKIDKLNLESARENLKKSFAIESDMSLNGTLDVKKLASQEKEWTNSPVKKLYHIGCMYCDSVFVLKVQDNEQKAQQYAKKAIKILEAAKKTADSLKDRKRNTWYISERIAWVYMHIGKYEVAAKLLKNARAGYVINTYAIALMLCGDENKARACEVLKAAVNDKHNLAAGLSKVLYAFASAKPDEQVKMDGKEMSEKNKKLAQILNIEIVN
jgi:tetratricopeptide (TPR) repeat protein